MTKLFERIGKTNEELSNIIAMNIIASRITKGLTPEDIKDLINTIDAGEPISKKYSDIEIRVTKNDGITTINRVGEIEFAMDRDGVKSFKKTISRLA